MLQIKNIRKRYVTGELVQQALDNVSLNFRDNEFVAILGPSGSGKTTLLNVIGGLDRYDDGDLIINGVSTKKYKDRDWDAYRNHTIGFVFQSYNLIPHQTVLSNVELALTIGGISKAERKKRAREALEKVGLGDQLHKKPNQMSGGQMQRVAIARALVNDPDILLADEPTGALDTETSIQVMDLLKEVAKDRLVVMVTHNPELAEEYSTRLIKLKDGEIIGDTDPYEVAGAEEVKPVHRKLGKASMSFLTALSLSFNNLRTKKARTFLTAFAGSIGIIGIALILSLSTGVNSYINDIQKDTMTSYPITITAQTMDLSTIMGDESMMGGSSGEEGTPHEKDAVYSNGKQLEMASSFTSSFKENNLTDFKKYLDNSESEIHGYVGTNGIAYTYDVKFSAFSYDTEGTLVNTDGSTLTDKSNTDSYSSMMTSTASTNNSMASMMGAGTVSDNNFSEILPGRDGEQISSAVKDNYEMIYGEWPDSYDETIIVVNSNNEISATTLYYLGLLPTSEYKEYMKKIDAGEEIVTDTVSWSYEEICKTEFSIIPACDFYVKNDNGTFTDISDDDARLKDMLNSALKLKVTGIVRANDEDTALINSVVGYTKALTDYLIDYTNESEVVKAQQLSENVNVVNGMQFAPEDDKAKIEDAKKYLNNLGISEKARFFRNIMQSTGDAQTIAQINAVSENQLAAMLDQFLMNPDDESMLMIYNAYISSGSYSDNMKKFGVVSLDAPSAISIYADSFEAKDSISTAIANYNKTVEEEDKITYTDYVGLLMSSVTTIINVISYVLIAFVAVSLIVSSIMIGIITYISVLERTKEIGILRAMGASKRNVSRVFNAETFIVGLISGLLGVGISLLILIPGNALIHSIAGTTDVNAYLPVTSAVVLIIISVILTLIGGLIPAKKAAKRDPVTALRSE
ncbi:MAG: ABC transporter ATP-binding protein/permease [Eubacteriales bacterium]|nr:ABC transporter ATP-binding protein/permease [Eubacteriales bacterium]